VIWANVFIVGAYLVRAVLSTQIESVLLSGECTGRAKRLLTMISC